MLLLASRKTVHDDQLQVLKASAEWVARRHPTTRTRHDQCKAIDPSESKHTRTLVLLLASRQTVHDDQLQVLKASAEWVARRHPTTRTTHDQCKAIDPL